MSVTPLLDDPSDLSALRAMGSDPDESGDGLTLTIAHHQRIVTTPEP